METKLSKKETEILESFEKGEWVPIPDIPKRKKELVGYAQDTLRKNKKLKSETRR